MMESEELSSTNYSAPARSMVTASISMLNSILKVKELGRGGRIRRIVSVAGIQIMKNSVYQLTRSLKNAVREIPLKVLTKP